VECKPKPFQGAFDEYWPTSNFPNDEDESWETPDREASQTKTEMDWEDAYVQIAVLVGAHFPECEVTTVDMVRLLLHENATLRMALNIPPARVVLATLEELRHD
jgi:hypothetical protein